MEPNTALHLKMLITAFLIERFDLLWEDQAFKRF